MTITNLKKHYRLFLVVIFFGLILVGASCKDTSYTTTSPDLSSSSTTPEQAWAMYVEGWKEGNLSKILEACGPTPQAQTNCREIFNLIQNSDKKQFFIEVLNQGQLIPDGDQGGSIRNYYLYFEDKNGHASFENFKDLGWRLTEF